MLPILLLFLAISPAVRQRLTPTGSRSSFSPVLQQSGVATGKLSPNVIGPPVSSPHSQVGNGTPSVGALSTSKAGHRPPSSPSVIIDASNDVKNAAKTDSASAVTDVSVAPSAIGNFTL